MGGGTAGGATPGAGGGAAASVVLVGRAAYRSEPAVVYAIGTDRNQEAVAFGLGSAGCPVLARVPLAGG